MWRRDSVTRFLTATTDIEVTGSSSTIGPINRHFGLLNARKKMP